MISTAAMVEYPRWFFATDVRRIDAVLTEYHAPETSQVRGDLVITRPEYASEAVAVQAVLAVFQVIVQVLLEHVTHQSAHTLRWEAHRLLDGVIAWAETPRPITRSTLDDFIAMVQTELDHQRWWQQFLELETISAPAAPASPSPVVSQPAEDDPLWSIPEVAERLRTSPDTVKRMIKKQELRFVIVGKRKKIPASELKRILTEPKWLYRDKT